MDASIRRLRGVAAAIATCLFVVMPVSAGAQTVPTDVRVVASDGQELTDVRQYLGKTVVPTSPAADCFGPGNGGSGAKVTQIGPDALSAVVEASASKERLRPLLISDAFLDDGFGLGLCAVGGYAAPPAGFWYLKVNHKNPNLGGSLVTVGPDSETLWYLTPTFPPGAELALNAPVRALPGAPVPVQVLAYDDKGAVSAAAGAIVLGGDAPAVADGSGVATLTFAGPGTRVVGATRSGDIPSQSLTVCVADPLTACAAERGREVLGTDAPDYVLGTLGPDRLRPRDGNDAVSGRAGDDLIVSFGGGTDKVKCGAGEDLVEADKKDRIGKSCERVKGGRKAKAKGKGGSKK